MTDPALEAKARQRIDEVLLTGNSDGERPECTSELKPRQARSATKSGPRLFFEFAQYFCLLAALVCLGDVAIYYARAGIFQSYQHWRFDQSLDHRLPSLEPLMVRWGDRVLGAIMKTPNAWPQPGGAQARTPALPAPPPAPRSLPNGFLIGRLDIPRLGMSVMVLQGDDEGILQKAVGHVPSTALPGAIGNVAVAGHRDTFFRALKEIRPDDEITLTTTGGSYNYRVGAIEKVAPQDVQVLAPSDHPTLTLITCYPFDYIGAAPRRYIVQADEVQPAEAQQSDRAGKSPTSLPASTSSVVTGSNPVANGSVAPKRTSQNQSEGLPQDPPPKSHRVFTKVRTFIVSIPHRLRLD